MSGAPELWSPEVKISGSVVHGLAILTTVFRLSYRCYMSRFWWEDAWAAIALIADIACLVSVWTQIAPQTHIMSNWLLSVTLTVVLWAARMSILYSIIRIANPPPKLRRIAYCIVALFLTMGVALVAQKFVICEQDLCRVMTPVAIAQLVTDIVSDAILVAAPIRFLRDVKLSQSRRVLILSAFSASILISGVTILHSVLLFKVPTTGTIVIGHVKAALSLIVCNALVVVTFIYRVSRHSDVDLEHSVAEQGSGHGQGSSAVQFTSVVEMPSGFGSHLIYPTIQSAGLTSHITNLGSQVSTNGTGSMASGTEKSVTFRDADLKRDLGVCEEAADERDS
ncbi:hypothetical protein HYDPIDRAFT_167963 [Hydnomerulius pinastri MD-312]|uniref:Transmembrane protein n=1 Tax=Hydnomerulius pinastri MD-312 TaxID=994086 RepID=A0A0C9W978_9AGAM|nr:hypothetical protein HYDPIDRAFT_167963 [Hydnomerulius pinastri MD-312]